MTIILYDLAGAEEGRRFSPYCWRTRMALAHKALPVETIAWRFTDKEAIAFSGQVRVPVIVDKGKTVFDSWSIAEYLEHAYPDRPSLFGGVDGKGLTHFYSCFADTLVAGIFRFIALDILSHVHDRDRAYFRKSREERIGGTLESCVADRDVRVASFRDSLAPLRLTLKTQPYLGGDRPLYADYAVFGPFQWARCISPFTLLARDDPVAQWRDRLLDSFNGLALSSPGYDDRPST
jgi:glutathione S-transferase